MNTVLIIEDEQDIRELLAFSLRQEGFTPLESETGEQGIALAKKHQPTIILLDVMLPGMDGFAVSRTLAANESTKGIPVIMLTARGQEVDRIVGFELGAVDYIVKPFSLREVALRIKAVLRLKNAANATEQQRLSAGPVVLTPHNRQALVEGEAVPLTATEYGILHDLLRHKGIVRSREQIMLQVWGDDFEGYTRTVDVHVKKLRAKLGSGASILETIRGFGYMAKDDDNA